MALPEGPEMYGFDMGDSSEDENDNWSVTQRTPCSCCVPWALCKGTKGVIKGHGLSVRYVIEAVYESLFGTLMLRVARIASLSARLESSEVEGTWM